MRAMRVPLFKTIAALVLSACSFLMLTSIEALWWIGFACAVAGLVLSTRLIRLEKKPDRQIGMIGVILAVAGAIAYLVCILV